MQSMIASQQQLIRRNISNNSISNSGNSNSNSNNNNNNNNSNNNSLIQTNNTSNVLPCDEWSDSERNRSSLISESNSEANQSSNQSIASDLSDKKCVEKETKERSVTQVSQMKKRRTNTSWLNLLSPSYKTRHQEFKRLFSNSVPNNERLVVDYSCALQKEILVQGRLYLSLNYIAFYANIFKWETSLVIKCRDITSLSKANTARVIPNAIQVITTSGDKYVFTSFAARDKTHVMLFRIWQNALLDQPMSTSELWQWVHYSYGEDLGLTSEDDEEYYNENMPNSISTHSQVVTSLEKTVSHNASDSDFSAEPEVYEDCLDQMPVFSQCKCQSHEGRLILNVTFAITVDHAFELIFTDNKFIHNLHKKRRTHDLCVTQWEDSQNEKVRQLNYTVALNHALVKSAPTIEVQHLLEDSIAGSVYMIRSEADNEGVPYCDTFSTHSQWCLTQDSANVTRLKVHAKVFYKKSIWGLGLMKPMIEKSSIQGITDFCKDLANELPHWIEIERNLAIVNGIKDLNINADNIDTVSSISSIDETLIQNGIDVSEMLITGSTADATNNRIGILSHTFHPKLSDAFLLKLIFSILILIFFLNIMVFIRLSQLESKIRDVNAIPFAITQMPDNSIHWKQFIENAIKMIKSIETNLLELRNSLKDEL